MKKLLSIIVVIALFVQSGSTLSMQKRLRSAGSAAKDRMQHMRESAAKKAKALSRWPKKAVYVVKKKYIDKVPLSVAEQQLFNQLAVGTIASIVTALSVGGGYLATRESDDAPIEITPSSGTSATYVGEILQKFKVKLGQDDSPSSLFIKAVTNGAGWMVEELSELVPQNVLQAGQEIAQERIQSQPSIYVPIQETINKALAEFSSSRLRNNLQFIRSAFSELIGEVQRTICLVSPKVVAEAIEQLKRKKFKSAVDEEMLEILERGCPK